MVKKKRRGKAMAAIKGGKNDRHDHFNQYNHFNYKPIVINGMPNKKNKTNNK